MRYHDADRCAAEDDGVTLGKGARVRRWRAPAVAAALGAATLVAFWPLRHFGFVHVDDAGSVSENPVVQGGLTPEGVRWALTSFEMSNWHPLTWVSLMLDRQVLGPGPGGFHAVNLLLHLLTTLLLFAVIGRMTGAFWRGALVAALFALHPLHVESVAWISERKDVLSALFWVVALGAYDAFVRRRTAGRYLALLLLVAAGLASKPMVVTLPAVLLLLDAWPYGRAPLTRGGPGPAGRVWGALLVEKLPLAALSIVSSLLTLAAQSHGGALASFRGLPLGARSANALLSYGGYLGKAVWPARLSSIYSFPRELVPLWREANPAVPATALFSQVAAAALLLAAVTLVCLRARSRSPWLIVGWLWYLGTLVPVIGFVQVGGQSMADRYTYLPLIGVFLALAWEAAARLRRRGLVVRGGAALLGVAALLALAVLARAQVMTWRTSRDLLDHALAASPDNWVAWYSRGRLLIDEGRLPEAQEALERSLEIYPFFAEAQHTLATVLSARGDHAGALSHARLAVQLNPGDANALTAVAVGLARLGRREEAAARFREALAAGSDNALTRYRHGLFLAEEGRHEEAVAAYRAALAREPGSTDTLLALASSLEVLGRGAEAEAVYGSVLRVMPRSAAARVRLGVLLAVRGEVRRALALFAEAIDVDPRSALAHYNYARTLDVLGESPEEALRHYREAIALDPGDAQANNDAGALLAELGRTAEARARFEEALRLRPDFPMALENLARLGRRRR